MVTVVVGPGRALRMEPGFVYEFEIGGGKGVWAVGIVDNLASDDNPIEVIRVRLWEKDRERFDVNAVTFPVNKLGGSVRVCESAAYVANPGFVEAAAAMRGHIRTAGRMTGRSTPAAAAPKPEKPGKLRIVSIDFEGSGEAARDLLRSVLASYVAGDFEVVPLEE